jgi:hypothetical protein
VVRDPLPSPTRRSNRKRRETAAAQREKWYRLVWSIGAVALVGVIALVAGLSDKGTASARPAGPVATGPAQPDRP